MIDQYTKLSSVVIGMGGTISGNSTLSNEHRKGEWQAGNFVLTPIAYVGIRVNAYIIMLLYNAYREYTPVFIAMTRWMTKRYVINTIIR